MHVRCGFPFNYETDVASNDSALICKDKSLAVQSEKDDADINTIVRRFGLTGQVPQNVRVPLEADFVEAIDFQSALNAIRSAQDSFDRMPAGIRARFDNDPAQFVDFCAEPGNLDEMRKLGLAVPAPVIVEEKPDAQGKGI